METETNQHCDHWGVIPSLSLKHCVTLVGYITSLGLVSSGEARQLPGEQISSGVKILALSVTSWKSISALY